MGGPSAVEVLLALLDPTPADGVYGDEVMTRLASAGVMATPSGVLARLVSLEASGHVAIDRKPDYRFALTPAGHRAAYDLGPGHPIEVTLVMADIVGFVAFTERAGDAAAHATASAFHAATTRAMAAAGGAVVKSLGDGALATAPSTADAVRAVRDVAHACAQLDGGPFLLRAAVHAGRPVAHRGDVFGMDVNLVSRLCELAPPGHALVTGPSGERFEVRGLTDPITAERVPL